ncbi:CGNR zinc finger domain-containing protein [Neorhizobium galegae]|uniref:CGNR zinc finger domain-containing protein n=1 Tax=Neorhizobium galegae TaxID=399 RepID=UPI0006279347|nr:ABATE domain-containing protein [Neorhizobium galegae]MCQ1769156.1 CGNR zinc finger domain-containing protein [Neorhizobium galegae]MCQ1775707.1 CGNR zinc finger domain-containing protein [Neorhizobium galegae]MCQ1799953.1 CGNR zinc finger domain-containing protein [Neorhizobium galegae]MCQ1846321.1 CGNR zinc finger domain-containing protein [Neorhizobium galegae]
MATSTTDMRLSGGHAALELANTVDSRRGRWGPDLLLGCDDIITLARRVGLLNEKQMTELSQLAKDQPQEAKKVLLEAIRLREAIYAIFLAEDGQKPYPKEPFAIVHDMARRARARQVLCQTDDGFRWVQPLDELADLVNLFAAQAAELLTNRHGRRPVRSCKGDNCGWLFLDTSKSGRRLWCSEASCGTHARVKRFREKKG